MDVEKKGAGRAFGYTRVSTDEQANSGLGLEAQRASIERYAQRENTRIIHWFADEGISGAAPLDKRRGLLALLDELRAGDVLVVAKRDRLARDVYLAAWLDKEAKRRGARIVSAAGEGTDDDEPTSMLMRQIVDAFAQYERAVITARNRATKAVLRSRGEKAGGLPYGYRAEGKKLIPIPKEQEALAMIRAMRGRGAKLREIAAALVAGGYLPKRGVTWHPKVIARLAGD